MQYLSISIWLISLSVVPFHFTHIVTNDRAFFFLKTNNVPSSIIHIENLSLCVCMCVYTHTHTHTLRLFLCIGYCALQKTVQISFQDSNFVSLGYVPRSGIAGSYGSSILISWDASTFLQQLDVPVSTQDKYIHLAMWILQKQLFKKRICLTRLRFLRAKDHVFHVSCPFSSWNYASCPGHHLRTNPGNYFLFRTHTIHVTLFRVSKLS